MQASAAQLVSFCASQPSTSSIAPSADAWGVGLSRLGLQKRELPKVSWHWYTPQGNAIVPAPAAQAAFACNKVHSVLQGTRSVSAGVVHADRSWGGHSCARTSAATKASRTAKLLLRIALFRSGTTVLIVLLFARLSTSATAHLVESSYASRNSSPVHHSRERGRGMLRERLEGELTAVGFSVSRVVAVTCKT